MFATGLAESAAVTIPPLVQSPVWRVIAVLLGYALTLSLSGVVVRFFTSGPQGEEELADIESHRFDPGAVIGKCENILALTFILTNQATGLAVIFAAKSLVRREEIRKNPSYYLGGTLVNLVWSIGIGFLLRLLLFGA